MAKRDGKDLDAVDMGSVEGFVTADSIVSSAAKHGTWVMLKNCHLCTDWLQDTLKKKFVKLNISTFVLKCLKWSDFISNAIM